MWSHPDYLMHWYAPRSCRLQIHSHDFRVGGRFRTRITVPGGHGAYLGEAMAARPGGRLPELTVTLIEEFLNAPVSSK